MADYKKLTKSEIDRFLQNNQHGILALAGDKPYALPMGYLYRRKAILLGLATAGSMVTTGRKMDCLTKSKQVCFTVCKPRWYDARLKTPCTTLVIEGSLEEVKNRTYYGIRKIPHTVQLKLYKLKVAEMGARKCKRKPRELLAARQ